MHTHSQTKRRIRNETQKLMRDVHAKSAVLNGLLLTQFTAIPPVYLCILIPRLNEGLGMRLIVYRYIASFRERFVMRPRSWGEHERGGFSICIYMYICMYGTYMIPYISMIYLSGALPQVWAQNQLLRGLGAHRARCAATQHSMRPGCSQG